MITSTTTSDVGRCAMIETSECAESALRLFAVCLISCISSWCRLLPPLNEPGPNMREPWVLIHFALVLGETQNLKYATIRFFSTVFDQFILVVSRFDRHIGCGWASPKRCDEKNSKQAKTTPHFERSFLGSKTFSKQPLYSS